MIVCSFHKNNHFISLRTLLWCQSKSGAGQELNRSRRQNGSELTETNKYASTLFPFQISNLHSMPVASTQRYGQVLQDIDPGINGGDPPPLPPPYGRTERWSSSLRSYISDCNPFDPHCVINPIYEGCSSKERENLHPARFLSPGDPESSSMLSEFYDGNGHHVFMGPRNVTTGDLNNPYENIDIIYTGTLSSGCHTESTSLQSNRAIYSEIGNIT